MTTVSKSAEKTAFKGLNDGATSKVLLEDASASRHGRRPVRHLRPRRVDAVDCADDSVRLYMKEIARYDLLSADEEARLASEIADGADASALLASAEAGETELAPSESSYLSSVQARGFEAKRKLVESNLRLVVWVAKRYASSGMPLLDLVQEGSLGLMKAAESFDYHLGYRFSTYAIHWVRSAILRGLANKGRLIRLPVHKEAAIAKLVRVQRQLVQDLGREATLTEIEEAMGVDVRSLLEIEELSGELVSLEQPFGDKGESCLSDLVEDEGAVDPFENAFASQLHDRISCAFGNLTVREALVLSMYFGLDVIVDVDVDVDAGQHSLKEISETFGLSVERIRQIMKAVLEGQHSLKEISQTLKEISETFGLSVERIRQIMKAVLKGQHSLKEISETFGLSVERIRQIKKAALEKMREPSVSCLLASYIDESSRSKACHPG